ASLVPVLSIGENDVYDVIPTRRGTFAYNLQQLCKSTFGWTVPLFSGRGVFNYSIGVLPHRRRIATIVCAPVHPDEVLGHVLDVRSMSADEINEATRQVHEVYMQRLIDVWNKYKDEYAPDRVKEMEFVE
ncbi:diacylglycerol acyltransferase, partial [Blastocladiella britannica]